jgi:anti-sigma-K factor RskA
MSPRGDDRPGCAQVREIAPDVALGLLTGEERAEALAHLEGCEACRAEVASLAVAADEVLLAAPEATPPAGFDTRVLAALATQREAAEREGTASVPARRHRRRRRAWVGAAAAAVLALVVGLAAIVGSDDPPSPSTPEPSAVATVAMRGNQGRVVGEATMTGSRPVQVVVDMPDWGDLVERWGEDPAGGYWLVLETRDGARTMQEIREGEDEDEAAEVTWTMAVDVAATDVAAVSVVDGDGRVWCSGRFTA